MKSRSREIGCCNDRIALKLDRHLGSVVAEVPVKFQIDLKSINLNSAASRLQQILRLDILPLSEQRPSVRPYASGNFPGPTKSQPGLSLLLSEIVCHRLMNAAIIDYLPCYMGAHLTTKPMNFFNRMISEFLLHDICTTDMNTPWTGFT